MFGFHRKQGGKPQNNPNFAANLKQNQPVTNPIAAQTRQVDSLSSLIDSVAALNEKLGLLQGPAQEAAPEGGEWSWIADYAPYVGPFIGPYIPGLMEKLGIQPVEAGQTTTPAAPGTPIPTAAAGYNLPDLIKGAAIAPESMIRPFIGQLKDQLTTQGIDHDQFKLACQKIGKMM